MSDSSEAVFATPMMQQYLELKQQYQDCLLLFRLGDFYELFLEDAKTGSRVLGITLTSRTRGKDGRIPMAGVPYHALDSYLAKLIKAGYKVAICDQLTPPGKGLVERQVTRVISPGTWLDEKHLDQKHHNYLLCLAPQGKKLYWSAVDLSTGTQWHDQVEWPHPTLPAWLSEIMAHLEPSECLIPPGKKGSLLTQAWHRFKQVRLTPVPEWATWLPDKADPAHPALTITERYLQATQKTALTHLRPPQPWLSSQHLNLPQPTIANLELVQSLHDGSTQDTLLSVIDHTVTAMGSRLLRHWLLHPLKELAPLLHRQKQVAELVEQHGLRQALRDQLDQVMDLERTLARLSLGLGTPRDLVALAGVAETTYQLRQLAEQLTAAPLKNFDDGWLQQLGQHLTTTLQPDPPTDPRQGHLIQTGVDAQLDTWHTTMNEHQTWMNQYEQTLRSETGISSLKIKYNQVFGYYVEVSHANVALVPAHFQRTQTLVNAERFTTPELREHEQALLAAQAQATEYEYQLFLNLVSATLQPLAAWQDLAQFLAELDVIASLAELAVQQHYCQPTLTTGYDLTIEQGRHPLVEQLVPTHRFIPNDVELSQKSGQIMILTGPNMAGKSVLMRQTALIVLLAQIGSFVPATKAEIGLVDQIFVRSGASDRIAAGQSTFMVEMTETASILASATNQSLIIMDEIGRGTSTYDGISIAWAVVEALLTSPLGPKTLFATHYHELQALAEQHPTQIKNAHLALTQHEGQPVFLYQLKPGGTSHSFGLVVAERAGLPATVIQTAQSKLAQLESATHRPASAQPQPSSPKDQALAQELRQLSLETLTPLAALNLLAAWQKKYWPLT